MKSYKKPEFLSDIQTTDELECIGLKSNDCGCKCRLGYEYWEITRCTAFCPEKAANNFADCYMYVNDITSPAGGFSN